MGLQIYGGYIAGCGTAVKSAGGQVETYDLTIENCGIGYDHREESRGIVITQPNGPSLRLIVPQGTTPVDLIEALVALRNVASGEAVAVQKAAKGTSLFKKVSAVGADVVAFFASLATIANSPQGAVLMDQLSRLG